MFATTFKNKLSSLLDIDPFQQKFSLSDILKFNDIFAEKLKEKNRTATNTPKDLAELRTFRELESELAKFLDFVKSVNPQNSSKNLIAWILDWQLFQWKEASAQGRIGIAIVVRDLFNELDKNDQTTADNYYQENNSALDTAVPAIKAILEARQLKTQSESVASDDIQYWKERFSILLKGQDESPELIFDLLPHYSHEPVQYAALILWMLDRGIKSDLIINSGILDRLIELHAPDIDSKNNIVKQVYNLLNQSDNVEAKVLCDIANKTRATARGLVIHDKEGRLTKAYSLTGNETKQPYDLSDVNLVPSPASKIVPTIENIRALYDGFGEYFIKLAITTLRGEESADLMKSLKVLLNEENSSARNDIPKFINFVDPRDYALLSDLIDDETFLELIQQGNTELTILLEYRSSQASNFTQEQWKAYLQNVSKKISNDIGSIGVWFAIHQKISIYQNSLIPESYTALLNAVLNYTNQLSGDDRFIEEMKYISRQQIEILILDEKIHSLIESFETTLRTHIPPFTREIYIEIEDQWREFNRQFNFLQKFCFYSRKHLDQYSNIFILKAHILDVIWMENKRLNIDVEFAKMENPTLTNNEQRSIKKRLLLEWLSLTQDDRAVNAILDKLVKEFQTNILWSTEVGNESLFMLACKRGNTALLAKLMNLSEITPYQIRMLQSEIISAFRIADHPATVKFLCQLKEPYQLSLKIKLEVLNELIYVLERPTESIILILLQSIEVDKINQIFLEAVERGDMRRIRVLLEAVENKDIKLSQEILAEAIASIQLEFQKKLYKGTAAELRLIQDRLIDQLTGESVSSIRVLLTLITQRKYGLRQKVLEAIKKIQDLQGDTQEVRALINAVIKTAIESKDPNNLAFIYDRIDLRKLKESDRTRLFLSAIEKDHIELIKKICEFETEFAPNKRQLDKGFASALTGHKFSIAEYLLNLPGNNKLEQTDSSKTLISMARQNNWEAVIFLLMFEGEKAPTMTSKIEALKIAVENQQWQVVSPYLQLAGFSEVVSIALNKAASTNNIAVVKQICELEGNNKLAPDTIIGAIRFSLDNTELCEYLWNLENVESLRYDFIKKSLLDDAKDHNWLRVEKFLAIRGVSELLDSETVSEILSHMTAESKNKMQQRVVETLINLHSSKIQISSESLLNVFMVYRKEDEIACAVLDKMPSELISEALLKLSSEDKYITQKLMSYFCHLPENKLPKLEIFLKVLKSLRSYPPHDDFIQFLFEKKAITPDELLEIAVNSKWTDIVVQLISKKQEDKQRPSLAGFQKALSDAAEKMQWKIFSILAVELINKDSPSEDVLWALLRAVEARKTSLIKHLCALQNKPGINELDAILMRSAKDLFFQGFQIILALIDDPVIQQRIIHTILDEAEKAYSKASSRVYDNDSERRKDLNQAQSIITYFSNRSSCPDIVSSIIKIAASKNLWDHVIIFLRIGGDSAPKNKNFLFDIYLKSVEHSIINKSATLVSVNLRTAGKVELIDVSHENIKKTFQQLIDQANNPENRFTKKQDPDKSLFALDIYYLCCQWIQTKSFDINIKNLIKQLDKLYNLEIARILPNRKFVTHTKGIEDPFEKAKALLQKYVDRKSLTLKMFSTKSIEHECKDKVSLLLKNQNVNTLENLIQELEKIKTDKQDDLQAIIAYIKVHLLPLKNALSPTSARKTVEQLEQQTLGQRLADTLKNYLSHGENLDGRLMEVEALDELYDIDRSVLSQFIDHVAVTKDTFKWLLNEGSCLWWDTELGRSARDKLLLVGVERRDWDFVRRFFRHQNTFSEINDLNSINLLTAAFNDNQYDICKALIVRKDLTLDYDTDEFESYYQYYLIAKKLDEKRNDNRLYFETLVLQGFINGFMKDNNNPKAMLTTFLSNLKEAKVRHQGENYMTVSSGMAKLLAAKLSSQKKCGAYPKAFTHTNPKPLWDLVNYYFDAYGPLLGDQKSQKKDVKKVFGDAFKGLKEIILLEVNSLEDGSIISSDLKNAIEEALNFQRGHGQFFQPSKTKSFKAFEALLIKKHIVIEEPQAPPPMPYQ